jgi:hypothetical protein
METGIGLLVLALIGAIGIMIVKTLDKRDDRLRDQADAEFALHRKLREIATIEQVTNWRSASAFCWARRASASSMPDKADAAVSTVSCNSSKACRSSRSPARRACWRAVIALSKVSCAATRLASSCSPRLASEATVVSSCCIGDFRKGFFMRQAYADAT